MNRHRDQDDESLVRATRSGDREAFEVLVDRHLDPIFGVAYALTGCRTESDDVVQEAFLAAYQGLGQLRDPARFGPWLAGIARRLAANRHRSRVRSRTVTQSYAEWWHRESLPDTRDREEDEARLWDAMSTLPESLRVPLLLYYFEGESTGAVAERLGLEPATARKRLQIARDRLRDRLEKNWEESVVRLRPGAGTLRASILTAVALLPSLADASAGVPGSPGPRDPAKTPGASAPPGPSRSIFGVGGVLLAVAVGFLAWMIHDPSPSPGVADSRPLTRGPMRPGRPERSVRPDSPARIVETLVAAPGSPDAARTGDTSPFGADPASDRPDVAVDVEPIPAAVVRGTVHHADGRPVVGQVFLGKSQHRWEESPGATLGPDGAFEFRVHSELERWLFLQVGGARVALADSWVRPSFEQVTEVDLILAEGVSLVGRVTSPIGTSIEGAVVVLSTRRPNAQGEAWVSTDARGAFTIPHLCPGDYQVVVRHHERSPHFGHIRIPREQALDVVLAPPRELRLRLEGLPDSLRGERIFLSLEKRTADTLPNREDLLFSGVPDSTGTLTLRAPPPGHWEGTFFESLQQRPFRLEISEGSAPVATTIDLRDGARLAGVVVLEGRAVGSDAEVVLMDIAGVGGRGRELHATIDRDGRYRLDGVPGGSYLIGVRFRRGGWPQEEGQPLWTAYFLERRTIGPHENFVLDLTLPTTGGLELEAPPGSTAVVCIGPEGPESFFEFAFGNDGVTPREGTGVLAIHEGPGPLVVNHLPPGRYHVELSVDDVRYPARRVEIHQGAPPERWVLTAPDLRTVSFEIEGDAPPATVRIQSPPAPPPGSPEYGAWLRTAAIRDRLVSRGETTRQVFAQTFADFSGWHYVRSLVVREALLEGTVRVDRAGRFRCSLPAEGETILRVIADGFEPTDVRLRPTEGDQPVRIRLSRAR